MRAFRSQRRRLARKVAPVFPFICCCRVRAGVYGEDLAERVKLTAAQSEVEATISAGKCREVIVPRSDQPGMMGVDSIATMGLFVASSE